MLQHFARIIAQSGMNLRRLHDRATGSGKPAKSLGYGQLADLPPFVAANTYLFKCTQIGFNFIDVQFIRKRGEALFVQLVSGLQELLRRSVQHHPHVQEFFPLHLGDNAYDRIFK